MIIKKKITVALNKAGEISTTQLTIPGKAIKLMNINEDDKNIDIKVEDEKVIVQKNPKGKYSFVAQKNNQKNILYRLTLTKDIANKLKITKNENDVILDFSKERLIIKKNREEGMKMETRILSIINFKGGVGKTTTSHSLAAGLTLKGKKVLLIDMDPQASLTFVTLKDQPKLTIKDVLVDGRNINEVIVKTDKYDIIPSNLILNLAERQLHSKFGVEKILKKALEKLEEFYEYIIIDCPPSMSLFTVNALYTSGAVLIPCETELLALDGLNLLIQTLEQTEDELDIKIKNTAVLPTKLDQRKKLSKEILGHLRENFKTTDTVIRTCSKLNLLGLEKKSIFEIEANSTGSKDYAALVEEITGWHF